MSTHSQINHLSTLENGDITAISDDVVDEIWTQSHSIGVPHGLKIVRTCTKEDFSCGDEFYYVEMKDVATFNTFTNYMDYTEDTVANEIESDIITFTIGHKAPEGRPAYDRTHRRMKRAIIRGVEMAFWDDESCNLVPF